MNEARVADGFEVSQILANRQYTSANEYYRTPPASSDNVDHSYAAPGVGMRAWSQGPQLSAGKFRGVIPSGHNPVLADLTIPYRPRPQSTDAPPGVRTLTAMWFRRRPRAPVPSPPVPDRPPTNVRPVLLPPTEAGYVVAGGLDTQVRAAVRPDTLWDGSVPGYTCRAGCAHPGGASDQHRPARRTGPRGGG